MEGYEVEIINPQTKELLLKVDVYILNTVETAPESLNRILNLENNILEINFRME